MLWPKKSCKKKKNPSRSAISMIVDFKNSVQHVIKILSAIKGSKIEWSCVMDSWRAFGNLQMNTAGVNGFMAKRECIEATKLGKLDNLTSVLSLDHDKFDLYTLMDKDAWGRDVILEW